MMARCLAVLVAIVAGCSLLFAQAEGVPRIVSTSPAAFATDVDPSLDKITVTFDRPMTDDSWSWTGGGDPYPQTTARPYYDEAKTTCTLPVKLEPGKVYRVGINSPSHRNFKSASGEPAMWYMILFATRSADGKPTPLPADMEKRAREINARHGKIAEAKAAPAKEAAPGNAEEAAIRAAEQWFAVLDAGDYQKVWDTLDPMARKLTDQATFTTQVKRVRDAFGKVLSREFRSSEAHDSLPGAPDGKYLIMQFGTSFQNKREAVETAVMRDDNGTWKVSGYFVK